MKITKYSTLLGVYSTQGEAEQKSVALFNLGFTAYVIAESQDKFRLYSGAFATRDGAEANTMGLSSKGIRAEIAVR